MNKYLVKQLFVGILCLCNNYKMTLKISMETKYKIQCDKMKQNVSTLHTNVSNFL